MPCDWHGSELSKATAAPEACARAERKMGESPRLREYSALFTVVSALCGRFDQHVRTRSGQACAERAKAFIERAIKQRHYGDIDQAVACLHSAVISIQKGGVMEETFGPRLEQLWHGYDAVAQGVEPGSEAHEYLERFVVAVDIFNDATVQDDTDYIVERFDIALDWLKRAALARHRR